MILAVLIMSWYRRQRLLMILAILHSAIWVSVFLIDWHGMRFGLADGFEGNAQTFRVLTELEVLGPGTLSRPGVSTVAGRLLSGGGNPA